jgi:hypothetical protein
VSFRRLRLGLQQRFKRRHRLGVIACPEFRISFVQRLRGDYILRGAGVEAPPCWNRLMSWMLSFA